MTPCVFASKVGTWPASSVLQMLLVHLEIIRITSLPSQ